MKKILISAPSSIDQIIKTYPMIHLIENEMNPSEINIVVNETLAPYLSFLEVKCNIYPLPIKKNTLWGVHHFAYNLKEVFNIDTYFDLIGNIKSGILGQSFRCIDRVGIRKNKLTPLFINHPKELSLEDSDDFDTFAVKLFSEYLNKNFDDSIITADKGSLNSTYEGSPFINIIISNLDLLTEKNNLLKDFFECFDKEVFKIYIIGDFNKDQIDKRLEDYKKSLSKNNHYFFKTHFDQDELIKNIKNSIVNISEMNWIGTLCSYYGKSSYVFNNENENNCLHHFKTTPNLINVKDNILNTLNCGDESIKLNNMAEVADHIYQSFNLVEN